MYLQDQLSGDTLASFDNSVCQAVVVMVHQINTCVVVCYRPPDTQIEEFSAVLNCVDSALAALPTPVPNIVLMGDLNFPRIAISWQESEEGYIFPIVAAHRTDETPYGKQDRLQAHRLMEFAAKYFLQQQVISVTHAAECLDLIWTNNCDLVSSCHTKDYPEFSDHRLVTACTAFKLEKYEKLEEQQFMCPVGSRYSNLDFSKAVWCQVEAELDKVDWDPMKDLANTSPDAALAWFHEKVLLVLEEHVPKKKVKAGKPKHKMHRMRRLLWRRLAKVDHNLKKASTMNKKSKLLAEKWELEKQLASDYSASNNAEEDEVVLRMKQNSKAFFSFARSRQTTRSKVGPFLDPTTNKPNSSPDYCCRALQRQYDSVFAQPRPEWLVDNLAEHFKEVPGSGDHSLTDVKFSRADIEQACLQLSGTAAAGPDGVPASLLKSCRKPLSLPLYYLWRGSMD